MKIIYLLIALSVLGLINSTGITATTITGINSGAKGRIGSNTIKFAIVSGDITGTDKVLYLSTASTPTIDSDPNFPIISQPTGVELIVTININTPGTYNVFLYDKTDFTLQTKDGANISIVITDIAPTPTIITKIEATNPVANKTIKYKFTLASPKLKSGDKIYLTKGTSVASTDKSVTIDRPVTDDTIEKEYNLTEKGTYIAYINRGDDSIKQTTAEATIEVGEGASSGYISYAFALLVAVFLF